jgi:hypothetical protein
MTHALNQSPSRETDLHKISKFQSLTWLSASELRVLANSLKYDEFESSEVILHEGAFASKAQILTRGIARITCRTPRLGRVTIAFVAPGLIPQLPSLSPSRFDFRCEAHNDCRVGSLARGDFNAIATRGSESARNAFHQNNLRQWHRVLSRSSDFLTADLHERIAVTMLELASCRFRRHGFARHTPEGTLQPRRYRRPGRGHPAKDYGTPRSVREGLLSRQGRRFIV